MADGYEATILPDIFEVVYKADQVKLLLPQQGMSLTCGASCSTGSPTSA